jgi:predicted DNA-binding ribbon-helix-helix protein
MPSAVLKRSIVISGHRTSVSLEDCFWSGLKEIARDRQLTLSALVSNIEADRPNVNLSSTLRMFVLNHFRGVQVNGHGQSLTGHADLHR